ncbi:MAG: hypothetical protein KF745_07055 [Phycisphaeraceae bacterium]|nr:hypothetical protein [Phycisphaeraceae bacterium]
MLNATAGISAGSWGAGFLVGRPVQPLSERERADADHVARRLHAELRSLVACLNEPDRGASAMSRALSLDRATCQRIVAATSRSTADPETLVQLPGVMGLRQFVEAMSARTEVAAEQIAAATAAIDRFAEFLDRIGASQRKLKERLGADRASLDGVAHQHPGASDDPAIREALFMAAAAVTGRSSEVANYIRVIRPVPGMPGKTEWALVKGLIGHRSRTQAVPLVAGHDATQRTIEAGPPVFATLDDKPASGPSQASLLAPFCSQPLPSVTSRNAGPRVVHVIDTDQTNPGPADIVIASRSALPDTHPASLRPAVGEVWLLQTFPARRLIFDVYLHRDIARRCIPSIELHLWEPDVGRQGAGRWATQFPGGPRLELLGPGLSGAATDAYPRHADLTSHLFSRLDWPADEFVGYRCDIPYPVWRAGYCMVFDFAGNETE